ncbi:nucleoside triphosphate pyrophosphohydrolase [Stenotrophomonas sp. CPCC 101365]|uniref:Nucleoside triphosphate pyrophosphohydrolase n=2 Tax=Stenotrophomonas mori TaxID=2871096 RepID=A0ABT0SK46_9GAMM|nr:nucleoside triphosphate pyrophosphohydrolase [Stenotrophomonas mori]
MARLRDPQGGCPWDLAQDFSSIAPYTVEEAYEVADAIDRGDLDDLRDELGDLLLQVVFHAQMAQEQGAFDFGDVVASISGKMLRRHPHVFGDAHAADAGAVVADWERIKQQERADAGDTDPSALAGIARGLPEWQRALKLQKRAARTGFDWPDAAPVLDKLREEADEVQAEFAAAAAGGEARLEEEIGDLLFVCANLARHAEVDVGSALRRANLKFERRFRAMEALAAARGQSLPALDLVQQEALWQAVKRDEQDSP